MATALRTQHIQLARTLPGPLQTFFGKYWKPPLPREPAILTEAEAPQTQAEPEPTRQRNPFAPFKHPITGAWHGPIYSLRRQAQIVKLARENGIEELLPPGKKSSNFREKRREELGLRVRGTGVGQKVKGHKWERKMGAKLRKRKEAMMGMPQMIEDWKKSGHGRKWKQWPK